MRTAGSERLSSRRRRSRCGARPHDAVVAAPRLEIPVKPAELSRPLELPWHLAGSARPHAHSHLCATATVCRVARAERRSLVTVRKDGARARWSRCTGGRIAPQQSGTSPRSAAASRSRYRAPSGRRLTRPRRETDAPQEVCRCPREQVIHRSTRSPSISRTRSIPMCRLRRRDPGCCASRGWLDPRSPGETRPSG